LCYNVADSGSSRYVSPYHDSIPACSIRLKQEQLNHNHHALTFRTEPVTSTIAIPQKCLTEQRYHSLRLSSRSGQLDEFGSGTLEGGFGERQAPTDLNIFTFYQGLFVMIAQLLFQTAMLIRFAVKVFIRSLYTLY